MTNSIDIKYRADTSQSVVATDKLLARITKLEGQLSTAVGKSSKVGSALGKSYADAEARVKHFEKALKSATSVTTKYRALEGLQEAVRAFKIAKADFEDSMKVGDKPAQSLDAVAYATAKLASARDNAWNAEQQQLRQSASLRQDIISKMTAQVSLEKKLAQESAALATQLKSRQDRDNAWNAQQMQKLSSAALKKDMISRAPAQSAADRELAQQRASALLGSLSAKPSEMISQMNAYQSQQKMQADAARRQQILDRDAQVVARQNAVARARELDRKYASRYALIDIDAKDRRGKNVIDSEATLTSRRSLLNDRMQNASPDSLAYKNMLAELTQIEAALKRIAALNKSAVSPGKTIAAVDLTSVKALRMQIKYLKSEMDKVGAGQQWDVLNQRLALAEAEMEDVTRQATEARKAVSAAATAPVGSWMRLGYELEQAKNELSQLTFGTKEFINQQKNVASLQKEWDKLNNAVNRTNKTQGKSNALMTTMVGQITGLAASYMGAYQAIALITDEWKKQRDIKLEMSRMGSSMEDVLHRQAVNIGSENLESAKKWARDNQRDADNKRGFNTSQEGMLDVLGYAMSSGASYKDAKSYSLDALELSKGNPELAAERVLGGVAIAKKNNSTNLMAGMGQMDAAAAMAQGVDNIQFIENTMDKMAVITNGTRNLDPMTTEEGLEWFTTGSRVMTDTTSEAISANIARAYIDMSDFTPKRRKKGKDGKDLVVPQAKIDELLAMRNFGQRMEYIARPGNEALAQQFEDAGKKGMPRNTLTTINTSPLWQKEMAISKAAIPSFADAEGVAKAHAKALDKAIPMVLADRKLEAGNQHALTAPEQQPYAKAMATWDSMWNGNKKIDFYGADPFVRYNSFKNRTYDEREKIAAGMNPQEAEVAAMLGNAQNMQRYQREKGNTIAADQLEGRIDIFQDMLIQLKELNAQVAAGKNAPPPAARPVAPVAKAPPVPRMPAMNFNAPGGDVFGWFKK